MSKQPALHHKANAAVDALKGIVDRRLAWSDRYSGMELLPSNAYLGRHDH